MHVHGLSDGSVLDDPSSSAPQAARSSLLTGAAANGDWPVLASSARSVVFANSADACGRARVFVAADARGLARDTADDLAVMVSELVGNAVSYTDGPVTVRVERVRGKIRIEVGDTSDVRIPERSAVPPHGQSHGRGLMIVEALATAWGAAYEAEGGGKVVWFELVH